MRARKEDSCGSVLVAKVVVGDRAGSRPEPYGLVTSARGVPEPFGVEDGDAPAGQAEQAVVGVVAQHLGAGLAGRADKGGELFVGEGDLRVASDRPQRACWGLGGGQGGGDALGDGLCWRTPGSRSRR
ncbi:hypothetical protein GCM10010306_051190 [Streptomyces umbrinus]|nr:hypothetical protein GCM10010306_051190 [Streptomyces umbrinus]